MQCAKGLIKFKSKRFTYNCCENFLKKQKVRNIITPQIAGKYLLLFDHLNKMAENRHFL